MLFSFQISFLFLIRKVTIALFYVAALYLSVVYIQVTGSDIGMLFLSSLPLVKPKCLTKDERSKYTLSQDLKEILIGLILGDLFINKQKKCINARLEFTQGVLHMEYLQHSCRP